MRRVRLGILGLMVLSVFICYLVSPYFVQSAYGQSKGNTFVYPGERFTQAKAHMFSTGINVDLVDDLTSALSVNKYSGGLIRTSSFGYSPLNEVMLSPQEIAAISKFVQNGGRLYIAIGKVSVSDINLYEKYFHFSIAEEFVSTEKYNFDGSVLFPKWKGLTVGAEDLKVFQFFMPQSGYDFYLGTVTSATTAKDRAITIGTKIGKGEVYFTSVHAHYFPHLDFIVSDKYINDFDNLKSTEILFDWLASSPAASGVSAPEEDVSTQTEGQEQIGQPQPKPIVTGVSIVIDINF